MQNVFVDTNIVIDLLQKRPDFYREAQELFTLADEKKVKIYVSALTIANANYILSRHFSANDVRKILIKFKILVDVLAVDDKIIELALVSDFKDFEDAIQYYSAVENDLDLIITRNKKDFKNSILPVLTANEFLKR
jgi:predicted nucleic acid-binding protein